MHMSVLTKPLGKHKILMISPKVQTFDCIQNLCYRERGEPIPADQSLDIARRIKERYCYIAADIVKVNGTLHGT